MKKQILGGALLMLFSSLSLAHSGDDLTTVYMGFIHTVTGWDHLLMIIAVGILAAKSQGHSQILLPASFVIFMLFGACLGLFGFGFSALEATIAASIVAMALLLMLKFSFSNKQHIFLVVIFATLHGLAHGLAVNSQQNFPVLFGMLMATALLLVVGFWLGVKNNGTVRLVNHALTYSMLLLGSFFLFN